ncbi:hypothetical protein [Vibrio rumoiensis]|nr:hypothetical protein [Vibrio rumoiensis]
MSVHRDMILKPFNFKDAKQLMEWIVSEEVGTRSFGGKPWDLILMEKTL